MDKHFGTVIIGNHHTTLCAVRVNLNYVGPSMRGCDRLKRLPFSSAIALPGNVPRAENDQSNAFPWHAVNQKVPRENNWIIKSKRFTFQRPYQRGLKEFCKSLRYG